MTAMVTAHLPTLLTDTPKECIGYMDVQKVGNVEGCIHPDLQVRDASCIIIDWDDTLFPTSHVQVLIERGKDPCADDAFMETMAAHAAVVKEFLRTARRVARVAIVTLAKRPWVDHTAKKYWTDFDFDALLSELEIPIYYAQEFLTPTEKKAKVEGVDLYMIAKRNAMSKSLRTFRKGTGSIINNLISIGDSFAEHEAMKEVGWSMDSSTVCKSVLFVAEPCIGTLSEELRMLIPSIGRVVAVQDDLDLDMSRQSDLDCIESGL